jgi:NhaP-type Na+/H+ or K+/H+ antiporter
VLRTLYPAGMSPGHPLWVVCLIWLVATHLGELFERCGSPKALGMLLAGVALRSTPALAGGMAPLEGLNYDWSRNIRAGAMALVLLRAGLGLNLRTARSYGASFLAFVIAPSLLESLLGALVAMALFRMPFLLAWAMGYMISAVGPGVVSAACAAVKERGYAARAPNFLMTTMCFDDAGADALPRARTCAHRGPG